MSVLLHREHPSPPNEEMARLVNLGFSLIPLGGGSDGKSPLRSLSATQRIPLKQVLGPMYGKNSCCFGVRLDGLVVIDCDADDPDLVKNLEARFGVSPVHVKTPRGIHLYYRGTTDCIPNLRGEALPVDIKHGVNSYVVGPHSVRPDGGVYVPAKGVLGINQLPLIAAEPSPVPTNFGAIATGNRNRELGHAAINMVETVETPDELFENLAFIRDDECEDPTTIPDEELRKIAEWAWNKRLGGKVYRNRESEFRFDRSALDRLTKYDNASDAIALFVILQDKHGHIKGKTFELNHAAMLKANRTNLGRRRFNAAIVTLRSADLLGVAKEYSVGNSRRTYRLLRIRPDFSNVQSLFETRETS